MIDYIRKKRRWEDTVVRQQSNDQQKKKKKKTNELTEENREFLKAIRKAIASSDYS